MGWDRFIGLCCALLVGSVLFVRAASATTSNASWSAEGNQSGAVFGQRVASAGDVNGDGYDDVIVGASFYDHSHTDEGRAFAYPGSATGLSTIPSWSAEGNQRGASLGQSVASAGDVNGDGYDDVIVGASYYDHGQGEEGRALAYLGSATGLSTIPSWSAEGNRTSAYFGISVASAGDVNGDGYDDVIVGASYYDHGQPGEGRAFAYLGSATGLSTIPSWSAEGNQAGALFGTSVASAGDVNGDGYDDVIVGAYGYTNGQPGEGRTLAYLGSATGLSTIPSWSAEGNQTGAEFGISVASAGDVNGDGYDDVIVGASGYTNGQPGEGRTLAYLGSATGLSTIPSWSAEGNQMSPEFGGSVASAGDVNGDGYADVIVGAYAYDHGKTDEGRAWAYLGSATGLSTIPSWWAEGNQTGAAFGTSVASAGDVNGDGYADVIVGAYAYDHGQTDEGGAVVGTPLGDPAP